MTVFPLLPPPTFLLVPSRTTTIISLLSTLPFSHPLKRLLPLQMLVHELSPSVWTAFLEDGWHWRSVPLVQVSAFSRSKQNLSENDWQSAFRRDWRSPENQALEPWANWSHWDLSLIYFFALLWTIVSPNHNFISYHSTSYFAIYLLLTILLSLDEWWHVDLIPIIWPDKNVWACLSPTKSSNNRPLHRKHHSMHAWFSFCHVYLHSSIDTPPSHLLHLMERGK